MTIQVSCPNCCRSVPARDDGASLTADCSSCRRTGRRVAGETTFTATPPGTGPLLDALPVGDDRLTTEPGLCPPRSGTAASPPWVGADDDFRPRLDREDPEMIRRRKPGTSKGVAGKIALGLGFIVGGAAWFFGGLAVGHFFRYPIVLVIGGFGLLIDGLRRRV